MKKILLVASLMILVGCGKNVEKVTVDNKDGKEGSSCTVMQGDGFATISCTDGTSATVADGQNGINGVDGLNGADGQDGQDGTDGQNGTNGQSCSLSSYVLQCGNDSLVLDSIQVVALSSLGGGCSNASEVLLKIGNALYRAMNHTTGAGNNGVLKSVALEPLSNQTYSTTSSSGNCTFTVNNGTIQ